MSKLFSPQEGREMLKWLNHNRWMLLDLYKSQYVAYNANGLIAHGDKLLEVLELASVGNQPFLIYLVPRSVASVQILSILFRTVVRHSWLPNYPVKLKHGNIELMVTMLVDSGAEVSLISWQLGKDLGLALADAESTWQAGG